MVTAAAAANKKPGTAMASRGPSAVPDYLQKAAKADAGKGVSQDRDDSLVPMAVVLQVNTPQAIKQKPEYLGHAAEGGDIWFKNLPNPVVKSQEGILVQPVHFWKSVVEWVPKNKDGSGGGYVATHETMPEDAKEVEDDDGRKRMMSPRSTEYVETRNHAVIAYTEGGPIPFLLPMSGSQHTVSRAWTFMQGTKVIEGVKLPSWAVLYRMKTVLRTKGQQNWFVFDPHEGGEGDAVLYADEEQYAAGKALHEAFATGAKKAEPLDAAAAPGAEPTPKANDGGGKI